MCSGSLDGDSAGMTDHLSTVRAKTRRPRLAALGLPLGLCLALASCTKDTADSPTIGDARPAPSSSEDRDRPTQPAPEIEPAPEDTESPPSEPSGSTSAPDETSTPPATPDPSDNPPTTPDPMPSQPAPESAPPAATGRPPKPAPPPTEIHKPNVILSEYHAQTCAVKVGDSFPALTLTNLQGEPQELASLYGDRQTIVVFWNATGIYAREQFARIMQEGYNRYHALGINVVAINVGDSSEVVQELAAQYGVTTPCLLDPDGQAFQKVATRLLPRTYLLDAEGRILWFDLEYSRGQRQSLHNAVHYHLKQGGV